MPEGDLRLADALRVGEQPLAVEVGQRAGDDELVRHAARLEAAAPEAAELDRVVDQLVVVGRLVDAARRRIDLDAGSAVATCQPRGSVPICEAVRLGLAALDAQAQRRCR